MITMQSWNIHRVCGQQCLQVLKCCFCGSFFPWILGRVEQVTKTLGANFVNWFVDWFVAIDLYKLRLISDKDLVPNSMGAEDVALLWLPDAVGHWHHWLMRKMTVANACKTMQVLPLELDRGSNFSNFWSVTEGFVWERLRKLRVKVLVAMHSSTSIQQWNA